MDARLTHDDIVFFDGDCLFCQARVQWLQAHDRDRHWAFAPLQGELAARLLAGTGLAGADGDRLSTMVVVSGATRPDPWVFTHARAVAAVAARLPFPWRLGALIALVPRPIADALYAWVARHRHQLGALMFKASGDQMRTETACPLPPS